MRDYDRSVRLRATLLRVFGGSDYASSKQALAEAYIGRAFILTVRGDDMKAQRNLGEVEQIGVDATEAQKGIKEIKSRR